MNPVFYIYTKFFIVPTVHPRVFSTTTTEQMLPVTAPVPAFCNTTWQIRIDVRFATYKSSPTPITPYVYVPYSYKGIEVVLFWIIWNLFPLTFAVQAVSVRIYIKTYGQVSI